MRPEPMPLNILMYSDYRLYLKEYYETRKASQPSFSFRYLSTRAGINSSAFYKYIIDGKRNLTKTTILKTCAALKLMDKEAEYFENLVFFNQAKTIKEKNLYFDKLTRLRGDYERRRVEESQYAFYGEWHHSAVRELLGCMRFKWDYPFLAKCLTPSITPSQAEESVALLARLGMAKKDAQGRWRQADPVLTTGGQVDAAAVVDFQKRMLELALEAFDRAAPGERLMSSTTFGISPETFDLFKKKIRDLKAELLELARLDGNPSRAYQLNLNLFPLSRENRV
ncbi:MAG: TIGR02147 family protein [Fibrobacteres bacterium]|nr:TIGR02147 family protein [Fibrobacterota bacterium]